MIVVGLTSTTLAKPPSDKDFQSVKQAGNNIVTDKKTINSPSVPPQEQQKAQQDIPNQVNTIETIASQHNDSPEMQSTVTQTYIEADESKRALPHANQYVDLARQSNNPTLVNNALALRATVNYSLRNYPAVARDAQDILKRDPNNEAAQRMYALSRGRSASGGEGAGAPSQAATAPGGGGSASSGGLAPYNPNRAASSQMMNAAQQTQQAKEAAGYRTAAERYLGLGDYKEAKKQLDMALAKVPGNAQLLSMRSKAELGGGDKAAALADAQAAVQSDAMSAESHWALGQAIMANGGPGDQARQELAKAKELDPAFSAEYEKALAGMAAAPEKQVDSSGVGLAGRNAMGGFNPQRARDQLFGGLPEPARKAAPIAIVGLTAIVIGAVVWLLGRKREPEA